jgi:mannonate dehydratase
MMNTTHTHFGKLPDSIDRRKFLKYTAGTALGTAAYSLLPSTASFAARKGSKDYWSPKLSESVSSVDDLTLAWLAQMGCEWVVLGSADWVDQDKKGYWTEADIELVQEQCRKFGMELYSLMIPIGWLMSPMLAKPDRDLWISNIQRSIIAAGNQGIQMLEWRWSPDFKPHGPGYGYYEKKGRGGATYTAFDYDRDGHLPPYPELGTISRDELWERLLYFCGKIMKTAEGAGVKMSVHPKDPPVKEMRGISRVLTNTDEIEAFLDAVDSPANGFTFCQGTVTEMGVDVIDAIRRIGGRGKIHHVHFRNVRGQVPRYEETFIDEGDVDMLEAMRAYKEVNYTGSLVSDHTPQMTGENSRNLGYSFSHGYIVALVQAVNSER